MSRKSFWTVSQNDGPAAGLGLRVEVRMISWGCNKKQVKATVTFHTDREKPYSNIGVLSNHQTHVSCRLATEVVVTSCCTTRTRIHEETGDSRRKGERHEATEFDESILGAERWIGSFPNIAEKKRDVEGNGEEVRSTVSSHLKKVGGLASFERPPGPELCERSPPFFIKPSSCAVQLARLLMRRQTRDLTSCVS